MISLCEYRPPFLPKAESGISSLNTRAAPLLRSAATTDLMNRTGRHAACLRLWRTRSELPTLNTREDMDIDDHALVIVDYENGVKRSLREHV